MEPTFEKLPSIEDRLKEIKTLRSKLISYSTMDLTSGEFANSEDLMPYNTAWDQLVIDVRDAYVILFGGGATAEEAKKYGIEDIPGLIHLNDPNTVFYWLYAISQHDTIKPLDNIRINGGLRVYGIYPEGRESGELEESTKYEIVKLIGFIDIFLKAVEDKNQNAKVSSEDFLRSLGIDSSLGKNVITNKKGMEVQCKLDLHIENDAFESIEHFFTARTIVINAIEAGATNIVINANKLKVEIFDDASTSWDEPSTIGYKNNLNTAFSLGIENYMTKYPKEERGGAIAAFLAGQRYGRIIHSLPMFPASIKSFIHLNNNVRIGDLVGKSYSLDFPTSSTINDFINTNRAQQNS